MYLRFSKVLYFLPDESVRPWINKYYLLTSFSLFYARRFYESDPYSRAALNRSFRVNTELP